MRSQSPPTSVESQSGGALASEWFLATTEKTNMVGLAMVIYSELQMLLRLNARDDFGC